MDWFYLNDENNKEIIEIERKYILNFKITNEPNSILNDEILVKEILVENEKSNIITNIDDIIKIERNALKKYNALEIIQMQVIIIDYVGKQFKIFKLEDINFYIKYMSWIQLSSLYLTDLIRQPVHKNKTNILMRSSYKFCNKMTDCTSQYGFLFNKKCRNCINDHYVHNKIISDIDNLLNFLKNNYNKDNVLLEQDIRKGIETITYVLNHMQQELSSFTIYFGNCTGNKKYTIKDFYRYYSKN